MTIEKLSSSSREKHRFQIVSGSEDLIVNPAIVEKLKRDFGIEVPKFIGEIENFVTKFREVISGRDWQIIERCYLDIFSYQKYVMYEDLNKYEDLIFQSNLIKGYAGVNVEEETKNQDEMAGDIDGVDVLSADSSQKKAVEMAKLGETFVLQGPPGTGKSQTIVNIIAALMEQKKKILFVSQKMAALNVVQDRLNKIGLGRYCLNLHNYDENKKEVVNQLINELETSPKIKEQSKNYSFKTYLENQNKINSYYKFLCEKRSPRNFSVYDIRGELSKLFDVKLVPKELSETIEFEEEEFRKYLDIIEKLEHTLKEIPKPLENIYFNFNHGKNTSIQRENLKNLISSLSKVYKPINELLADIKENIDVVVPNLESLRDFYLKCVEINKIKNPPSYLIGDKFYVYRDAIFRLFGTLKSREDSLKKLHEKVEGDFLSDDTEELKKLFLGTNIVARFFKKSYKDLKKKLGKYSKEELNHKSWVEVFKLKDTIKSDGEELSKFTIENPEIIKLFGDVSNVSNIGKLNDFVTDLDGLFKWGQEVAFENYSNLIKYLISNKKKILVIDKFVSVLDELKEFFDEDFFNEKEDMETVEKSVENILEQKDTINTMILFKKDFLGLTNELRNFISYFFSFPSKNSLEESFLKSYYTQSLDRILSGENIQVPKSEINQFKDLDVEVRDIQRFKIMSSLREEQPTESYKSYSSNEVSILKRESEKKRNLKPIRELIEKIPDLVFTLKPCFMMSPLSVSQYINPLTCQFDVVIFDEASQIVPEDAVPSLFRSKQAIVVGDTKQLPPTQFFFGEEGEDGNFVEDELEDLESFLAECSTKFKTLPLLWHYRSKSEELIEFSNKYFYENKLITFPNTTKKSDVGVEFVYVENGIYDRGKTRKNKVEAKKVVSLYKKLLKEFSEKSVGVIAFSMAQENAIQQQFNLENIDMGGKIGSNSEDLFIKNLETVQGDERDIIILSIGYGKDESGKLNYNFGPINKEGGYKRLNVAFTRARQKVFVVCSLNPDELDDKKLKSQGSKYLKSYLEFVKTKKTKFCE